MIERDTIIASPTGEVRDLINAPERGADHVTGKSASAIDYLKALRPHQWLKNVLVFLPMLAAHRFAADIVANSVIAFVAFCVVASSVYVVNDLVDLAADRSHPRKRNRPFASGAIPITHGIWVAALLLLVGLILAATLGLPFALVILGYYLVTGAYSLYLKRQLVVDIFALAALYTTRIIAGAVATDIPLSVWLLAFSIFFFFSLAAIKRQAELVEISRAGEVAARGRGYLADDLSLVTVMSISSGYVSVLVMALYVNSPAILELYHQPAALWGICLVIFYWISQMVMVTHRGKMHDDPIVFAVKDRTSQICFLLLLIFAVGGTLL